MLKLKNFITKKKITLLKLTNYNLKKINIYHLKMLKFQHDIMISKFKTKKKSL